MKRLHRREFLKYTAAGASVVAVNRYLGSVLASPAAADDPYVNRNTGKRVEGRPTFCAGCGAGCGVLAYVADGELMMLKGNPAHPVNRGKLCTVGEAGFYSYYDPERVTEPLLRTGKRGEGRFRKVSWAEAEKAITARLRDAGGRIAIEAAGNNVEGAARDLLDKFGGGFLSVRPATSGPREKALTATVGAPWDIPDVANAEYVLNFGANPLVASHAGVGVSGELASRLAEGGLKLVTFDPRLSETAGRSDRWLPLIPGTDGFIALAMANVVMGDGLHDESFIRKHTNTTAGKIREHLKDYTPEAAERISGVKAEDIKKAAREYASTRRAAVITGAGVSSHPHGIDAERAIWLLAAVCGKVGRKGCNIIPEGAKSYGSDITTGELHSRMIAGSGAPLVYITAGTDPLYSSPDNELFALALGDESRTPFIVSIDRHVTDTGMYADVVLPMTTYLEENACILTHAPDGSRVIDYAKPAVRRKGNCRQFVEIASGLIAGAGLSPRFEDGLRAADDAALDLLGTGNERGLDDLDRDGFISYAGRAPGHVAQRTRFDTPKGAVMLDIPEMGGLPTLSAKDVYNGWKDVELALVTFSPAGYREGFTENNLLVKELNHNNWAVINAGTGSSMGLKNRDIVELKSPSGSIELPVLLSPGVHPNVVAVAEGCGHEGYGNIEKGERYTGSDPFTRAIWWGHDGHGVNPNKVRPLVPAGEAGEDELVTKVVIRKV